MVLCAIFGCSKRSDRDDVSFFRIPCVNMKRNYKLTDLILKRQKLWITRIKREDLNEKKIKSARICSRHFILGKPSALTDVDNPDWAPSINLGYGKVGNVISAVDRYQRRIQRKVASQQTSHIGQDEENESENETSLQLDDLSENTNNLPAIVSEKKDASCMTDLTMDNISHLEDIATDYSSLQNDYCTLKQNSSYMNVTAENFNDDKKVKFYTGLQNAVVMKILFNYLSAGIDNTTNNKLSTFQEFILFLMRLRLNLFLQDLGYRFNISEGTACRIFSKWLHIMYIKLKSHVFWPARENLLKTMPQAFKSCLDGHVAVIIDCFEISLCRPSALNARAATWSNYKQDNTVKFLVGIAPQGIVSFVSLGWGGRTSDKFITEQCGVLNNLIPGDVVLADRGFNNLNSVGFYCAKLVLPASARGKKQLHPVEVEKTRKIASLRIHVERVIGQLRTKYRILKGTLPIEMCLAAENDLPEIDKIVNVCCALVNFMPSVV